MVPGSIPGGVTGFFSDIPPSDRSMVLGSTQRLVKMSTTNTPWGKSGRGVRLTTSSFFRAECHGIWEPKLPGTLWATRGRLQDTISHQTLPNSTLTVQNNNKLQTQLTQNVKKQQTSQIRMLNSQGREDQK
jgi:hypothetical protein